MYNNTYNGPFGHGNATTELQREKSISASLRQENVKLKNEVELLRLKANEGETLKQENIELKNEIEQLKIKANEIETLQEENIRQKNDIMQMKSTGIEEHKKYASLQSELSRFTKYESVKKVKQVEEHLEILKRNFTSAIEELADCLKQLNRSECSSIIKRQMALYQQRKMELTHAGIAFLSEPNFQSMIEDYNKICYANSTKISIVFKPLHEATGRIEQKIKEFRLKIDDNLKDIGHFIHQEQNRTLKETDKKSVQDSMNAEKQLYGDILETIAKRIYAFDSFKDVIENKLADKTSKSTKTDYQHLIENSGESAGSTPNSVIMHNISENDDGEDDLCKVKKFLNQLNLETKSDMKLQRLESSEKCRPIKVTFSESQLVEKLLQLSSEETLFLGTHIRIVKCTK